MMTAKEIEERCRALAKVYDGHVTLDFEDDYVTATMTKGRVVVCCCRATTEEAVAALEEVVPQSIVVICGSAVN